MSPSSRVPMVAGNWKMNTTVEQGVALALAIADRCGALQGVEVAVLPPFTHVLSVRQALVHTTLLVGAQDLFWEEMGAYTGEVSAAMLAGWCDIVLVGHSERRHLFGETDEQTGRKFAAGLGHGFRVIVAVGETDSERDSGATFAVVDRQLDAVLAAVDPTPPVSSWLIAYEPVWAIGTGRTATPDQAAEVCTHIAEHVSHRTGGDSPRILYGGSVNAANARELFDRPEIHGGLIGGASLDPDLFASIVAAAAAAGGPG